MTSGSELLGHKNDMSHRRARAQIANYSKILANAVGLVKQTNRTSLRELSKGSNKPHA